MIGLLLSMAISAAQPINCDAKKDGSNILVHHCDGDVTSGRPIKIRKPVAVKPVAKPKTK